MFHGSTAVLEPGPHLLGEVQPAVVDVVLGEGGHWFRPLPERQVAVVGFADHQVMQLLWAGVVVLHLEERTRYKLVVSISVAFVLFMML